MLSAINYDRFHFDIQYTQKLVRKQKIRKLSLNSIYVKIQKMRSNRSIVYIFFVTSIVICVQCRQPSWNVEFQGDNLYALTTDSWQECGLLCTRNMQRTEDSIKSTTCSFWTWNDPSNREYNNVCRFHQEIYSK